MSRTVTPVALFSAATRAHKKARLTAPSTRGVGTLLTVASFNGPPQDKGTRNRRSTPRGAARVDNSKVAVELTSGPGMTSPVATPTERPSPATARERPGRARTALY